MAELGISAFSKVDNNGTIQVNLSLASKNDIKSHYNSEEDLCESNDNFEWKEISKRLEAQLNAEVTKKVQTEEDLNRLKEHLIALDKELTDEAQKRDVLVERFKQRSMELQSEVHQWRTMYQQQVEKQAESNQINDNQQALMSEMNEKDNLIEQLQEALKSLEASIKTEISIIKTAHSQQLQKLESELSRMRILLEDAQTEASMNVDLKRKIAELDRDLAKAKNLQQASENQGREKSVDRELVKNLLIKLFDRSRPIPRQQVANILCDVLGISPSEKTLMGLAEPTQDSNQSVSLADKWIAYLNKEAG